MKTSKTAIRKTEKVAPHKGALGITITLGNTKLPVSTAIWSLPAVTTCPGAFLQGCGAMIDGKPTGHCYALKAERLYKGVTASRQRNLDASRDAGFAPAMINAIAALLAKRTVESFRIHESGDMYSQAYLDAWFAICRAFPDLKFYTYTKSVRLDWSQRPTNLVVLLSDDRGIWSDKWSDFDKVFRLDLPAESADFVCGGDCRTCSFCQDGPAGAVISIAKH